MTAQGKDEVRHPGFTITPKIIPPWRDGTKCGERFFVRPFQCRKNVGDNDAPELRPSVLSWAAMWHPFRMQSLP